MLPGRPVEPFPARLLGKTGTGRQERTSAKLVSDDRRSPWRKGLRSTNGSAGNWNLYVIPYPSPLSVRHSQWEMGRPGSENHSGSHRQAGHMKSSRLGLNFLNGDVGNGIAGRRGGVARWIAWRDGLDHIHSLDDPAKDGI